MVIFLLQIEEVSADKERLLEEKRCLLERKMNRAEQKRRRHLQDIVNKAHDEDNKGREIAFINVLEAQNKLHDLRIQHQVRFFSENRNSGFVQCCRHHIF